MRKEITVISYRQTFQAAWELSTVMGGYLVSRQYMGYTKKQATQLFRQHLREIKGETN
jgi:hypothetical protein